MRIFSGIRASGAKTLGNYSGGFRQYAAIQEQGGLVLMPHPFDRLHTIPDATTLLRHLDVLVETGYPVLVGVSRKSFIGKLTVDAPVDDRLEGSLAASVWALIQGAAMVRVHDVAPTVQAVKVLAA